MAAVAVEASAAELRAAAESRVRPDWVVLAPVVLAMAALRKAGRRLAPQAAVGSETALVVAPGQPGLPARAVPMRPAALRDSPARAAPAVAEPVAQVE